MIIHKEGYSFLIIAFIIALIAGILIAYFVEGHLQTLLLLGLLFGFLFILQFFRNPRRFFAHNDESIINAVADGKIVVIEEIFEKEYFNEQRLLVSTFMSPLNVHVNRVPISGKILYKKHHPGGYLPAWNPKSSNQNERLTTVIEGKYGTILVKQIAGAMAKRIRNYAEIGQPVNQGEELGFIKFGSRVDLILPINAELMVQPGQLVKGNVHTIAKLVKQEKQQ